MEIKGDMAVYCLLAAIPSLMTVEALIPLLESDMETANEKFSASPGDEMNKQDIRKIQSSKDKIPGGELWNDGLICAFEFVFVPRRSRLAEGVQTNCLLRTKDTGNCSNDCSLTVESGVNKSQSHNLYLGNRERLPRSHWRPIGWARISELTQTVQVETEWTSSESRGFSDEETDVTAAEVATLCWE